MEFETWRILGGRGAADGIIEIELCIPLLRIEVNDVEDLM